MDVVMPSTTSAQPVAHASAPVHSHYGILRSHTGRQCLYVKLRVGRQRTDRKCCSSGRCRAVLEDKGGPGEN